MDRLSLSTLEGLCVCFLFASYIQHISDSSEKCYCSMCDLDDTYKTQISVGQSPGAG